MRRSRGLASGPAAGWGSPASAAAARSGPPGSTSSARNCRRAPSGTRRGATAAGAASTRRRNLRAKIRTGVPPEVLQERGKRILVRLVADLRVEIGLDRLRQPPAHRDVPDLARLVAGRTRIRAEGVPGLDLDEGGGLKFRGFGPGA